MRWKLWMYVLLIAVSLLAAQVGAAGASLPVAFVHDQVWAIPRIGGRELRFFTDTGGGWNAISRAQVVALGLTIIDGEADDDGPVALIDFPAFDAGHGLPPPPKHFMQGRLLVVDASEIPRSDGFLGGRWFADGIWEFDYPRQKLRRLRSVAGRVNPADRLSLGFQVDASGHRSTHFPSMRITVDGETLDMLLDSGATATLTKVSGAAFGLPAGTDIGTSFIEHEVFERWHQRHPDWRVLDRADLKGSQERRMIEVPQITVAGHSVGPVWFAEQPSGAFQQYMATMMDRPTWGALGGSALKYFCVVIDYPAAAAWFHHPAPAEYRSKDHRAPQHAP